jgi:hypothetical protein
MNENSQSQLNNRFGDSGAQSERISLGENDVMIQPSDATSRVVVHSGNNTEDEKLVTGTRIRRRKSKINVKRDVGLKMGFIERVYTMLEDAEREGFEDVVRWEADGRCFKVHNIKEFEDHIQPMYLHQSKLRSFQRKVNPFAHRQRPQVLRYFLTANAVYFSSSRMALSEYRVDQHVEHMGMKILRKVVVRLARG